MDDSVRAAPMAADGFYNHHSRVQALGLLPGVELLREAAAAVPLPAGPIVVGDYGCSTGRNSLAPMRTAIAELRRRTSPSHPITVVHTDQPDNDYATLFEVVFNDPDSYAAQPAVFPMAIGRSFYDQLLPSGSVTLGWCSWAVAWLSRAPAAIPDHVQVSNSSSAHTRDAYARCAAADWAAFLTARGAEMCEGARLVVVVPAACEDGNAGYRPMFEAAWSGLCAMVEEGLLQPDDAVRMGMPHHGRGAAELLAPFDGGDFAGLVVEHSETFEGPDEFWDQYQITGDAAAFGDSWAGVFAAGAFPSLATGLRDGPTDARADEVFERLEAHIAAELARAPQRMRIPVANLVLAKVAPTISAR